MNQQETQLKVNLISHTPEPEKLISAAAKLCYSQTPASEIMDNLTDEQVDQFLNVLMNMGQRHPSNMRILHLQSKASPVR